MKYLVFIFAIFITATAPLLTIEWFTWWAWPSVAVILTLFYEVLNGVSTAVVECSKAIIQELTDLEKVMSRFELIEEYKAENNGSNTGVTD